VPSFACRNSLLLPPIKHSTHPNPTPTTPPTPPPETAPPKAGCDFVLTDCNSYRKSNPSQTFFCDKPDFEMTTNSVCTFNGLARAKCEEATFADGCMLKVGGV